MHLVVPVTARPVHLVVPVTARPVRVAAPITANPRCASRAYHNQPRAYFFLVYIQSYLKVIAQQLNLSNYFVCIQLLSHKKRFKVVVYRKFGLTTMAVTQNPHRDAG